MIAAPHNANKMRNLFRLSVSLLFTLSFANDSARSQSAQPWHLVWSDEFNGPSNSLPSEKDWTVTEGWGPNNNHEIEWYCLPGKDEGPCDPQRSNLYEDGEGHLVLKAIHNGQRWSSARLETAGKRTFLYGRIEARLRMDAGAGFWPAVWLLGSDIDDRPWPECGELDIMEWVQKYGISTTSSTVHGPGYREPSGIGRRFTFPDGGRIDDGQFHVYGLTWSPGRLEFYRDNPSRPFFVVTPANLPGGQKWVFDHPFFLILNFAIGEAGFSGTVDQTTPNTGTISVDYVRFYQQEKR